VVVILVRGNMPTAATVLLATAPPEKEYYRENRSDTNNTSNNDASNLPSTRTSIVMICALSEVGSIGCSRAGRCQTVTVLPSAVTVDRTTGPSTVTCGFEEEVMVEETKVDEGGAVVDEGVEAGAKELKLEEVVEEEGAATEGETVTVWKTVTGLGLAVVTCY